VISSIDRIELGAYRTWSPDETVEIGGWTVGSNGGFTRRANSANTMGPADTSPGTGRAIREWLEDRGGRMAVRITPLVPRDVRASVSATWQLGRVDPTAVLVRPLSPGEGPLDGVRLVDVGDPVFTDQLLALNRRSPDSLAIWARLVDRLGGPHTGLWIPDSAVGFVAVADEIAFVYSVAVDPAVRRSGFGARVMEAAHGFAVDHGASVAALQVLGTNTAALRLYGELGYEERYRYHYLQPL
jgi:ribosomal protein S18 acetylase RimI-like enzyme